MIRAYRKWSGNVRLGIYMNGAGQGWSGSGLVGSGLVVVGRVRLAIVRAGWAGQVRANTGGDGQRWMISVWSGLA